MIEDDVLMPKILASDSPGGLAMRWGLVRWWAVALVWVMTCTLSARENSPPPRNDPLRVVATQSGVKQQNRPQTKEEDDRVAILLALRLLADRPNGQVLPPGVVYRLQTVNRL